MADPTSPVRPSWAGDAVHGYATILRWSGSTAQGYRAYEREPRWAQLTEEPYDLPHFVPTALGDLIHTCLASDPADRPAPREIAEALEPLLERLPQARLSGFKITL